MKRALVSCASAAAALIVAAAAVRAQPAPEAPSRATLRRRRAVPPTSSAARAERARARELEQAGERGATANASAGTRGTCGRSACRRGARAECAGHAGAGPDARPIATERPDETLPDGTIRVTVFDHEGSARSALPRLRSAS